MNRKLGLAAFDSRQKTSQQYSELGTSIIKTQSEILSTQLEVFQDALASFAKIHGDEIRENTEFRTQFAEMCAAVNVDPLVLSKSGKMDQGNEYLIAVRVIELCNLTRDENGGLISVKEIVDRLADPTSPNAIDVKPADIVQTVESLKVIAGQQFTIEQLGGKPFVRSIAKQLSDDQSIVLETCNFIGGYVSVNILRDNLLWSKSRAVDALETLIANGLIWIDTQDPSGEVIYWEPSWINET